MDEGENIFHRLDDNQARMEQLVAQVHERYGEPLVGSPSPNRRSRKKTQGQSSGTGAKPGGQEDIIAASALCQLAGPGGSDDSSAPPDEASSQAAS